MTDTLLIVLVVLALVVVALQVVTLLRSRQGLAQDSLDRLARRSDEIAERMERELRADNALGRKESQEAALAQRAELSASMAGFSKTLQQQMATIASVQNNQIDSFALQLAKLVESNEKRLAEVRLTLETKLKELQTDNATRLEEMRKTVDEKLHATLEKRLGESFKQVSDRLEAVHKGLGEMQTLAAGVGDLKRVLTNVKSRGTWGEVQLSALLEQTLTADQYAKNVATVPGSRDIVEFAIKLPGQDARSPVWLPIDSKFPVEDYERLLGAQEGADIAGVEEACKAIDNRIKLEAKTIREKYIAPPHTTDFAILFLPTEGLYAEALRRPGLADFVQREYRVSIAGPTTLSALLNSLQMGFRTLAIEQRSSEVWELLSAVKTEFGRFGDVLAKTKQQLQTVTNSIGQAETRTRQMTRKLKDVEALPVPQAELLLGKAADEAEEDDAAA
ncbi:MAG: DNA recombination protein RmuC [Proteobacteria bacterium]|nr:DNA recombination protein RmuC [Pseudomonadota bacterium]